MADFDPAAANAQLEQLEAMVRDTLLASTLRVRKAARERGADGWLANDIALEWFRTLLGKTTEER